MWSQWQNVQRARRNNIKFTNTSYLVSINEHIWNDWPGCGRGGMHVWPAPPPHPDGFSPSYRQTWDSSCPGKVERKVKRSVLQKWQTGRSNFWNDPVFYGFVNSLVQPSPVWGFADFVFTAFVDLECKMHQIISHSVRVFTLQTSSSPLVFSPWLDTLMVSSLLMTPRFTSRMNGDSWVQHRLTLARGGGTDTYREKQQSSDGWIHEVRITLSTLVKYSL